MVTLRAATAADAPSLVRIYNPYILNSTVSYEYTVLSEAEFKSRMVKIMETHPYLVAEEMGSIIGFAYASAYRTRAAYNWDVELSIYIDASCQGRGIGTMFLEELIALLSKMNFVNLYAVIDYPNNRSVALHKRFGFAKVAIYKNVAFKMGKWLDIIVMEKRINNLTEPKPPKTNWRELI